MWKTEMSRYLPHVSNYPPIGIASVTFQVSWTFSLTRVCWRVPLFAKDLTKRHFTRRRANTSVCISQNIYRGKQFKEKRGTQFAFNEPRDWLRLCATSRKVADSISDGVIGIFYRPNPSGGRTIGLKQKWVLGISPVGGCKGGRYVGLTNLPHTYADCLEILGASTSWSPRGI